MQSRRVLFASRGVSVIDFRCRAHVEPEGPDEPNATHSVVFVRRGVFGRAHGREKVVADANHVLFFNAAEPYRFSHPLPGGDDCTILTVAGPVALEVVARYAPRDAQRAETPFRIGHTVGSTRSARLHYELLALVRRGETSLVIEDVLSDLIDEAIGSAYGDVVGIEPYGASVFRRHQDLAEAAKVIVNERIDSLPSLTELARQLGCSAFHLSRTFRHVCGVSLRRYSKRLRLGLAADRLARGASDLTELALDLGYADHSHFTNSFRSEWGVSPGRFRAQFRPS